MYTYPGNIDGGVNFSHTDDGDILIEGKIDGGSRATVIAAVDVQIGVVGGDGDKKIDGGSTVDVSTRGTISLGNKIDGGSHVTSRHYTSYWKGLHRRMMDMTR